MKLLIKNKEGISEGIEIFGNIEKENGTLNVKLNDLQDWYVNIIMGDPMEVSRDIRDLILEKTGLMYDEDYEKWVREVNIKIGANH